MPKKLFLGNIDYRQHMTDEGDQLQRGFDLAGWQVVYGDGQTSVLRILERTHPTHVVVHDRRDWDPMSKISFRKDLDFPDLWALREHAATKVVVIKDAASFLPVHEAFYDEAGADAALLYYHPLSAGRHAPWMRGRPYVRTYHTIDADLIRTFPLSMPRSRGVVSGATSRLVYPTRWTALQKHQQIGIDRIRHPRYHNRGHATPNYLRQLIGYRTHVATASRYGFALRKIIESVACCVTPVTDLPHYDVLPEIDGALFRISPTMDPLEIRRAVEEADAQWNLEDRLRWARRCWAYYDFRAMAQRTSEAIEFRRFGVIPDGGTHGSDDDRTGSHDAPQQAGQAPDAVPTDRAPTLR